MSKDDEKEISRELRSTSDAVINLYAASIHGLIYPYDHPLVSDSLKNAYACLQKVFRAKTLVKLEPAKDKLLIDGQDVLDDLHVFRGFGSWLRTNKIKSLTFSCDVTRRELISFHRAMTTMKGRTGGELVAHLEEKGVRHVLVEVAESGDTAGQDCFPGDLLMRTRFESEDRAAHADTAGKGDLKGRTPRTGLSKEDRILPASAETGSGLLDGLFLSTRFEYEPAAAGTGEAYDDQILEMARELLVPTRIEEVEKVSEQSFPASEVESGDQTFPGNALDGGGPREIVEDIREDSVRMLLEGRASINETNVIREIPPDQMAHLLNAMLYRSPEDKVVGRVVSVYFERDDEDEVFENSLERCGIFLAGLKSELKPVFMKKCSHLLDGVVYTDEDADVEGSQAPPSGKGEETCDFPVNPDFPFDLIVSGKAVFHDMEFSEKTARLFGDDRIADFTGQRLHGDPDEPMDAARSRAIALMVEEFSAEAIRDRILDVLLELLTAETLLGEVGPDLRLRILALVTVLCDEGNFERVLDLYNTLKTQSLQGKNSHQASAIIRDVFHSDQVGARLAGAITKHGRRDRENASKLTRALRSSLVPHLLDTLVEEPKSGNRRFIIALLVSIRSDVLPHIVRKLNDSRWYVIRNMLYLLRECNGRKYASDIRAFLDHDVPLVRLEALRTLFSFQAPEIERYVLLFLKSDDLRLRKGATWLAGAYRVKAAVTLLLKLLSDKDIFGKNFAVKKGAVRALARISDGAAIGHFRAICASTSLIHKANLDKLKLEIFRTLYKYPPKAVWPLIDLGLESENAEIAGISRMLKDRYSRLSASQGGKDEQRTAADK